jgi:D-serine deaminase-like pyridoxal phosphate-dependent protein
MAHSERHGFSRHTKWLAGAAGAAVVLAVGLKPGDRAHANVGPSEGDRMFAELNGTLKKEAGDLPCAVIDLATLDRNTEAVKASVREPRRLRVVVKSLPSIDLLRYLLEKTGTRRLMVFHVPQIDLLLKELKPFDILLGKPMPAAAARAALAANSDAAGVVQWLIDTPERLEEYLQIARELDQKLRINIEIDVGLRRGGIATPADLKPILARIRENPEHLRFSGFMGYDGHVSHAPAFLPFGKERAVKQAFSRMLESYRAFVDAAKADQPDWFTGPDAAELTFNGGGSHTYSMYASAETPINDLAMGSAFVKPADFEDPSLAAHQPALFLAVPILKKLSTPSIPFLEPFWGLLTTWDPNIARGFYIYGSAWDSEILYPHGLQPGWFYDPAIRNLLPNQSLLSGSASVQAGVGDYIFLRPREGDGMAAFQNILAIKGGHVEGRWKPLPFLN